MVDQTLTNPLRRNATIPLILALFVIVIGLGLGWLGEGYKNYQPATGEHWVVLLSCLSGGLMGSGGIGLMVYGINRILVEKQCREIERGEQ